VVSNIQKGAVVRAARRIDHATVGDSDRIHRRLEDFVELRTIPVGGTDVSRAEWCVLSQSVEGRLEEQAVAPLSEQQLTVRQQIQRLWRRRRHRTIRPPRFDPPMLARGQKFLFKKLSLFGPVCAPTHERGPHGAATNTIEEKS
jgi:hypothetical protein